MNERTNQPTSRFIQFWLINRTPDSLVNNIKVEADLIILKHAAKIMCQISGVRNAPSLSYSDKLKLNQCRKVTPIVI
jgi:hypothetical protein